MRTSSGGNSRSISTSSTLSPRQVMPEMFIREKPPNLLFSEPPVRLSRVWFLHFLKVVSYTFLTKTCIIQRTVGSFIKSELAVEVNRHNSFAVNKTSLVQRTGGSFIKNTRARSVPKFFPWIAV